MKKHDKPVHVLQVMGNAIVGGMEHWVLRLVQQLPRERFRFTALVPFESAVTEALRAAGVDVWVADMPDDPPWDTLQTAAALVEREGIDLLHAHLPNAHVLAGLAGMMTARPVLATIHSRRLSTLDLEVHRALGTHLSVVCRPTLFHALSLGADPRRLTLETNGIDTETFRPRERIGALRRELGIPAEALLVGFVGRLSPEKGPEVFARAAMRVHHRLPDVHFAYVGEGPMAGELRTLAQQLGLAGRLHFAGSRGDMPQVYPEFDVQVACSHSEALPFALLEGMASGLPVVATRVGGIADVVEPGGCGALVEDDDCEAVARELLALLEDAPRRARLGQRARERTLAGFAQADAVARVGALIERLAAPVPLHVAHAAPVAPLGTRAAPVAPLAAHAAPSAGPASAGARVAPVSPVGTAARGASAVRSARSAPGAAG